MRIQNREVLGYYRGISLGILVVLMAACASSLPPIEIMGTQAETLKGEWWGEYSSLDTGRSGTIVFIFNADSDTAYGDVMMYSTHVKTMENERNRNHHDKAPDPLTIRFVQVREGMVTGRLAPYRDPDCGCMLETVFKGRLIGDIIEGTFDSYGHGHGLVQSGKWFIKRLDRNRKSVISKQ